MTNDKKELMQDLINQASDKVELLQKTVIEKSFEVERLKTEVKQAQIDVLNKVKTLIFQKDNPYDVPFEEFVSANAFCGYIDELIKEIENNEN